MERELKIIVGLDENYNVDVRVKDVETGFTNFCHVPYSPDEHPEFNEWIGNEIYSWLAELEEEMNFEED